MSLPTVKLTLLEWTNLITGLVTELSALHPSGDPIGEPTGVAILSGVLRRAIGAERADRLIVDRQGDALSKQDNHAIVRELYPVIPGETRDQKIDWIIEHAGPCFETPERFAEVVAFVRDRVESFEAAGGTLDAYVEVTEPPPPADDVDQADFKSFLWRYGGVNGTDAELSTPRLANLAMASNGLAAKWVVGMSGWGLANTEAGALACLFVQKADGTWVGGKFEWVSTSRSTRSLGNVLEGYNGWTLAGVPNPCKAAYVVLSADCKRRSNVVVATWTRGGAQESPVPVPDTPAPAGTEFSYVPGSSSTTITLPSDLTGTTFALMSLDSRVILAEFTGAGPYVVKMSGAQIRAASLAAKGKGGAVNCLAHTKELADGKNHLAGWKIPDPTKTYRGDATRAVIPD